MQNQNAIPPKYRPGDLVWLKRSLIEGPQELLTILWELPIDDDERDRKYLARTVTHAKKTVFHCEVVPAEENKEAPVIPTQR